MIVQSLASFYGEQRGVHYIHYFDNTSHEGDQFYKARFSY